MGETECDIWGKRGGAGELKRNLERRPRICPPHEPLDCGGVLGPERALERRGEDGRPRALPGEAAHARAERAPDATELEEQAEPRRHGDGDGRADRSLPHVRVLARVLLVRACVLLVVEVVRLIDFEFSCEI